MSASQLPDKVLVTRFGAMGDMVVFTSELRRLAQIHGPVDLLCSGGFTSAVLDGVPWISRRFHLKHRKKPWFLAWERRALIKQLCKRGYTHVYAWDPTPGLEDALEQRGAQVFRAWTGELTWIPERDFPQIFPSEAERTVAQNLLEKHGFEQAKPLIAIQPGNSRTLHPLKFLRPKRNLKGWDAANWTAVISALAQKHPQAGFALCGAPCEWAECQEIIGLLPAEIQSRCRNLAKELPVRTLVAMMSLCHGCISVDTGPAHIAAALGVPLVVLFGPADPAENLPKGPAPIILVRSGVACSPCYGTKRREKCTDNICMQRMSPQQVIEACNSLHL